MVVAISERVSEHYAPFEAKNRHTFTFHQLAEILLFRGYVETEGKREQNDFGALGGVLNHQETAILRKFSEKIANEPAASSIDLYKGNGMGSFFDGLTYFAENHQEFETANIIRKISRLADMWVITPHDLADEDSFRRLPVMAQLTFSQIGKELFGQIKTFLEDDGIITFVTFKKPAPHYLQAINELTSKDEQELEIQGKITSALTSPTQMIKRASHQFITVSFIPKNPEEPQVHQQGNFAHLTAQTSRRIDENIEEDYARLTLLKTILSSESKNVFLAIAGGVSLVMIFELAEIAAKNPQLREHLGIFMPAALFGLHFLNKLVSPLVADGITFYGQLKPWLRGENTREEIEDFFSHLFSKTGSHRRSARTSLGATAFGALAGQSIGEIFGALPGAILYNLIPFIVAGISSYETIKMVEKITGKPFSKAIAEAIKNNPFQLSIDIGAVLTTLIGIWAMGIEGKFNDPAIVAIIHGTMEHTIAAISTFTQLQFFLSRNFNVWTKEEIERWLKKGFI